MTSTQIYFVESNVKGMDGLHVSSSDPPSIVLLLARLCKDIEWQ